MRRAVRDADADPSRRCASGTGRSRRARGRAVRASRSRPRCASKRSARIMSPRTSNSASSSRVGLPRGAEVRERDRRRPPSRGRVADRCGGPCSRFHVCAMPSGLVAVTLVDVGRAAEVDAALRVGLQRGVNRFLELAVLDRERHRAVRLRLPGAAEQLDDVIGAELREVQVFDLVRACRYSFTRERLRRDQIDRLAGAQILHLRGQRDVRASRAAAGRGSRGSIRGPRTA